MPAPTISATVREVIKGDVNVPADEIVRRVRTKGVTASDASIRDAIYNVKSDLRKKAAKQGTKAAPKPVPAAAREIKEPAPVAATAAPVTAPALDLRGVFTNVSLVSSVLAECGSPEAARKVAEAVKACGGVESFLLHLDLIEQVRSSTT